MNPIELYNELRFKGYFDYNLFSKVINQKYELRITKNAREEWTTVFGDGWLIEQLKIMDGDVIAADSFVDSDEHGDEMYGYIFLLPKGVGDNWYQLELYFHMLDEGLIEIEFKQMEEPEWNIGDSSYYGIWKYDQDKPLENILLNWLDVDPLEAKE